jgi:hypothetical protein
LLRNVGGSLAAALRRWRRQATSRCVAAANVTMSRGHHRRSHRAASTALQPSRCAQPPQRRRRAVAKLPPTSRCRAATTAAAAAAAAAAAPPFVGWLLRCCTPSDFVIACRHATINALVAGRFADKLCSTASTAATAAAAGPPGRRAATTATATTVFELTVIHWRRKRDDLLVDKSGTKTCYYSSGGALIASRRLPLQRFAMVGCCVLC